MEKELISCYKTNHSAFGYNKSAGGVYPAEGFQHSEESKQKMSQKRKGKTFSDEHRKNISQALIGIKRSEETKQKIRNSRLGIHATQELKQRFSQMRAGKLNPRYGVHLSPETKAKISTAHKGKTISLEQRKTISKVFSKPVFCVETGQQYSSITMAAQDIGVHPSCISALLHGKQKSVKTLHFQYLEDNKRAL